MGVRVLRGLSTLFLSQFITGFPDDSRVSSTTSSDLFEIQITNNTYHRSLLPVSVEEMRPIITTCHSEEMGVRVRCLDEFEPLFVRFPLDQPPLHLRPFGLSFFSIIISSSNKCTFGLLLRQNPRPSSVFLRATQYYLRRKRIGAYIVQIMKRFTFLMCMLG